MDGDVQETGNNTCSVVVRLYRRCAARRCNKRGGKQINKSPPKEKIVRDGAKEGAKRCF